jgi:PAS domain S-box-containing protein
MPAREERLYQINDIEEENHLRSTRALAAYICKVPGSLILLSDHTCNYLSLNADDKKYKSFPMPDFLSQLRKPSIFEIRDLDQDRRFSADEFFLSGVRFFAAAALISEKGDSLGYLIVHADQAVVLDQKQKEAFQIVASQLVHYLETNINKTRAKGTNEPLEKQFARQQKEDDLIGSLKPIVNQSGEIESSALILTDVTDLKKAEREIKRLSLVATESPNGILIRDATGRPIWVNKAFEKTSGYNLDELARKNIDELFIGPDTDIETLSEAVKNREKGEKVSTELLLYQKSGTPVWIQLLTYQILNEQGQVESSVTITNDVTEQKQKDEEFRMLSLVASKTVTGIIINDEKGKAYWCNASFEKITGYSIDDLKDQRVGDVIKGAGTDLRELKAVRDIEKQKRSFYTELLSYKKDGTAFWMAVSSTPVVDDNGRMIHVIDIIDDITERKQAEFQLIKTKDEALHLSKAKEMFLSVMSHEIRTPLNSVNAITQLLLDGNPTGAQIDYLNLLKFSGENLSTLINDILDLTKMETGNLTLEKAPVNLHELVKNTICSLQVKAEENQTELVLNIDPAVPLQIEGDAVRLYQILMNLAGNSIKFTKIGEVKISLQLLNETPSTVLIGFSIADTGIGIPEDKLEAIFEAYTQASSDTTRKFGGTGLGLTITKNLLDIHGSKIHVSSKPGEGSTFTFDIEFNKVVAPRASNTDQVLLSTSPILVVDDNAINRKIAQKVLAELYADIHFAENGEIAVEKVKATIYDCVLMDIFMPVMDGIEAAARIRSLDGDYFKNLPIIALTGSTDPKDLESIHQCGMNGHIVKPLSKRHLIEKISEFRRTAYAQFPF